ncbi:MFS transporter [Actibacterium sp. 188UL27-1]|uniref:MFS transporter n=1 Tax=Actibacterium sp. 188UL27-1 TaxID=2786961 RepID=UPI00195DB393|nr:MFS transporter [Actibacterium sp. 188UL27-1]MBM7069477.1 MFS transporter [Actibacterium sp. 188UL27-1]
MEAQPAEAIHASSLVSILSASNFVIGMGAFVVVGLLTPISTSFGMSTSGAGWVMTVYAIAYAISSPLLVAGTGRIGRRRVMAAGLGLFAVACLMSAVAPNPTVLLAARVLAAAGAGLFTPIAAATAAALSPPDRRARSLAAVFFGLTLAQVVGVPVGSYIAYTFGWRLAFGIVAALAVPCIWLIWTRVPAGLKFQPVSLSDLRSILGNGPVLLAVLFTTSFLGSVYVIYTYMAPLLEETMGFGRNGIALALVVFGCGAVIGNLLGGVLADRVGPVCTLIGLAGLQIVIMPVFSLLPLAPIGLVGLIMVWSVFGWSFMAGQQVRLIAMEPQSAGVVLALNAAAIYVGAALGSSLGGAVLDRFGLAALGIAGGAVAALALAHILISTRLNS